MNLRTTAGGLHARFAHLAGFGRPAATKSGEDEKPKDKDAQAAEEEDEKDKAAEDEEEEKASDDDGKDQAEEEDEDKEREEQDKPAAAASVAAARLAERRRCAAIFAAPDAAANIPLCAHLAFETDLPVKAAIGALKAGAAGAAAPRRGLADRMAGERAPRLGADGGTGTPNRDTPEGNADFVLNAGRRPRSK